MDWSAYAAFVGLATLLVLVPGADFTVVTRNALVGGRRRGWWSAVGVTSSNLVQGAAAAAGLAAVIVRIEPLFQAIRWAGIAYLVFLAVQALRSAIRGEYPTSPDPRASSGQAFAGWRQGFLSNITNPKVLVFYLAVLPAFLGAHAPLWALLLFASTHAALSLVYLFVLVAGVHRARRWLARRRVRRSLDAATGVALLGFSARLALD
ncbi:LysE family translocator [Petropleomorpha daqingensis]|uniref:Threonine/homoserine/homoserine lactone efflux protein n=1 Tax=Petropleomorpha daqingensis TaxID=2026353 RepID=A0A853CGD3_9ACTN|nr:threonine/homoserine/homoserine lactone efflux protein [Petropleomorpha daqingensis]